MASDPVARRPAVRWPFLVLAAVPFIGVGIVFWISDRAAIKHVLARPGALKAWAITFGIAAVMLAIPARTYRLAIAILVIIIVLALMIL